MPTTVTDTPTRSHWQRLIPLSLRSTQNEGGLCTYFMFELAPHNIPDWHWSCTTWLQICNVTVSQQATFPW